MMLAAIRRSSWARSVAGGRLPRGTKSEVANLRRARLLVVNFAAPERGAAFLLDDCAPLKLPKKRAPEVKSGATKLDLERPTVSSLNLYERDLSTCTCGVELPDEPEPLTAYWASG